MTNADACALLGQIDDPARNAMRDSLLARLCVEGDTISAQAEILLRASFPDEYKALLVAQLDARILRGPHVSQGYKLCRDNSGGLV